MPTAEPGESGSVGKAKPLAKNTPSHTFDTAIVWFRRDLRVDDNPALVAAVRNCRNVVPVYVFAPEEEGQFQPGKCSRWWLKGALAALNADLELLGSSLILRCGTESEAVLLKLVEETGATALFYNHLYDPISLVRDNEVKTALTEKGVSCYSFNSELLYEPWEVVDENGRAFTTFADFWNKCAITPCALSYCCAFLIPLKEYTACHAQCVELLLNMDVLQGCTHAVSTSACPCRSAVLAAGARQDPVLDPG